MPRQRKEKGPNELRIVRESRKLSQKEAAQLVGVSRPMWSSWECKARQMSVSQLNHIQKCLDLTDTETDRVRKWWDTEPSDPAPPPKEPKKKAED